MSYSVWRRMTQVCMLAAISSSLYAVDGVILIDQNHALIGNITPGDAPGFPVTISQPGSYRLSGDLIVPDANTTAIQITADHVTLDLNGFAIIGPTVCTSSPANLSSGNSRNRNTGRQRPHSRWPPGNKDLQWYGARYGINRDFYHRPGRSH